MLASIVRFYNANDIDYFLFAPAMTIFSTVKTCHVMTGTTIKFDNGAEINISFLTNLEPGVEIMTAPELTRSINALKPKANLPKYKYPKNVVRQTDFYRLARLGGEIKIHSDEVCRISKLDCMVPQKKSIYNYGYLISDAAQERLDTAVKEANAIEKVEHDDNVVVWNLSERELKIISELN